MDESSEWKVFYDSVHGHIALDPLLVKIIDTPQFQRLRNIKQLGGDYFVFPGASHNRFEHSIGVAHLAGKLVQNLRTDKSLDITDTDELCVKIAGLCHDLGHGPFSHVFEGFMKELNPKSNWKHEEMSVRMFDYLIEENGIGEVMRNEYKFKSKDFQFIKELIYGPNPPNSKNPEDSHSAQDPQESLQFLGCITQWAYKGRTREKSYLYQIVNNQTTGIDVDKMDYFSRDCHHLGIKCNFSHERYLVFARVCIDEELGAQICIRDKEAMNMYELFHIRSHLHHNFYHHRVTKAVENMIVNALIAADKKLAISAAVKDPSAYMKLTDFILQQILDSTDPELSTAREIVERLSKRDLYKFIDGKTCKPKDVKHLDSAEKWKAKLVAWVEHAKKEAGGQQTQFTAEDFIIMPVKINYGKNEDNPIGCLRFYKKDKTDKPIRLSKDEVSYLLPEKFAEIKVMVFYKGKDKLGVDLMKTHSEKLWEELQKAPKDQ
ncbi:deoxynucleoside triphosphate triphosphohydrolase SAMHD1-like [Astyanax mexicanus]|uniref:deoxynucleoside triphosphate triphosphohydrolase SAMHD1-like n=1 Tax=Astyanax mexicanus TaxID=7994 RepID=UPI0020CB312B|nr:deoxynucleoside triphosphate triphosphohydrolase SAMHD1-like [Astyanax mexicanus]